MRYYHPDISRPAKWLSNAGRDGFTVAMVLLGIFGLLFVVVPPLALTVSPFFWLIFPPVIAGSVFSVNFKSKYIFVGDKRFIRWKDLTSDSQRELWPLLLSTEYGDGFYRGRVNSSLADRVAAERIHPGEELLENAREVTRMLEQS